ncbi:F-box only protein 3 [Chytridiales sp. JEL 0842]|nr:F-box only protein 3 [Chytridiales sp. JEL 0842]
MSIYRPHLFDSYAFLADVSRKIRHSLLQARVKPLSVRRAEMKVVGSSLPGESVGEMWEPLVRMRPPGRETGKGIYQPSTLRLSTDDDARKSLDMESGENEGSGVGLHVGDEKGTGTVPAAKKREVRFPADDDMFEELSDEEYDDSDHGMDTSSEDEKPEDRHTKPKQLLADNEREDDLSLLSHPLVLFEHGTPMGPPALPLKTWLPIPPNSPESSTLSRAAYKSTLDLAMLYHLLSEGQELHPNPESSPTPTGNNADDGGGTPYALFGAFVCYREWYLLWLLPRERVIKLTVRSKKYRDEMKKVRRAMSPVKRVKGKIVEDDDNDLDSYGEETLGVTTKEDRYHHYRHEATIVNIYAPKPSALNPVQTKQDFDENTLELIPFAESNMFEWLALCISGPKPLEGQVLRFGSRIPYDRSGIPADTMPYTTLGTFREFLSKFVNKLEKGLKPFVQRDVVQVFFDSPDFPGTGTQETQGIIVQVASWHIFHADKFCYRIRLRYKAGECPYKTVQLKSRKWTFKTLEGDVQKVEGEGVIGLFPVLSAEKPFFEYCSYAPGEYVSMVGALCFVQGTLGQEGGTGFWVRVPKVNFDRARVF